MSKRSIALLATGSVLAIVTLIPPAGAQPKPLPAPVPAAKAFYLQREQAASPAIRTQLAALRQDIAARKLTYTVGYTTALDRTSAELNGLVVPPDIARQAAAHAQTQAILLQADAAQRLEYLKRHPGEILPPEPTPSFTSAMARVDWRTVGKVSPIRDQKNCGSCWAFAAIGAFESSYMIRNGTSFDTSEQAMLSCSNAGNCVTGGWTAPALNWLTTNGTDKEADFPYTATSYGCHPFDPEFNAAAWGYIRPDGVIASTDEMKSAIVTYGPIVVALFATDAFKAYTGGVYFEQGPTSGKLLNHAVVLVGWDDAQVGPNGAKGAWILRNSWGTGWGETAGTGTELGYMYLGYGSSNVGIWSQWVRAPYKKFGVNPRITEILKAQRLDLVPQATPLPIAPNPLQQK